jgi:hypothetical protein
MCATLLSPNPRRLRRVLRTRFSRSWTPGRSLRSHTRLVSARLGGTAPLHTLADGITNNAGRRFEPRELDPIGGGHAGFVPYALMAPAPCCVLRLQPSREYVTCSGKLARSQFTCGAGGRDEPQKLWPHKRRRNAEEKPLSRGGVPSRLGRHGELLAIRKEFLDRLTDGGPRVAGRTTESRARRLHSAQSHSYRGEISSNRRAARRPP